MQTHHLLFIDSLTKKTEINNKTPTKTWILQTQSNFPPLTPHHSTQHSTHPSHMTPGQWNRCTLDKINKFRLVSQGRLQIMVQDSTVFSLQSILFSHLYNYCYIQQWLQKLGSTMIWSWFSSTADMWLKTKS